jgi:hypothetical protein
MIITEKKPGCERYETTEIIMKNTHSLTLVIFFYISFPPFANLEMASTFNRTLFIVLFLFLISNSIDGYRLHQSSIDDDDDSTSNHQIDVRSVLWPKICFTTLIKKTDHQQINDQDQPNDFNRHRSIRNPRKCYPFDTV